jgi:hypothetical protein
LGCGAGQYGQADFTVALGNNAGNTNQHISSIAIGNNAGSDEQLQKAIAIGAYAGSTLQDVESIAIGYQAAMSNQNTYCIAIGSGAGMINQGPNPEDRGSIAIGWEAGNDNQSTSAIAMGISAGTTNQGENGIAIGTYASQTRQGTSAIAIGEYAAGDPSGDQQDYAIAIGAYAGYLEQSTFSVALGPYAGQFFQKGASIAIGYQAASTSQEYNAIAIGHQAGNTNQSTLGIAIGYQAAYESQGYDSIAIGNNAGGGELAISSENNTIAIGSFAAYDTQLDNSIAIGTHAGDSNLGPKSISIGYYAGRYPATTSGPYNISSFVAIGTCAGYDTTFLGGCIAIGNNAGTQLFTDSFDRGAIAIGNHAGGGITSIDPDSPTPPSLIESLSGSIAIGPYAAAYGSRGDMISIGNGANASTISGSRVSGAGAIAIGANTISEGDNSVVIGYNNQLSFTGPNPLTTSAVLIGHNLRVAPQVTDSGNSGFYTNVIRKPGGQVDPTTYVCVYSNTTNASNEYEISAQQMQTTTIAVGTSLTFPGPVLNTTNITYKTFVVDHPKKPDNYLVHACLEGPEVGVYYRGKAIVHEKCAKGSRYFVEVELPDYVDVLATDFTVHVTPIFDEENDNDGHYKVTEVKNGRFRIYGPPGRVNWIVYGSRGAIEVEPERSKTHVNGDGPYKWI